jgi:hypothetical protein
MYSHDTIMPLLTRVRIGVQPEVGASPAKNTALHFDQNLRRKLMKRESSMANC